MTDLMNLEDGSYLKFKSVGFENMNDDKSFPFIKFKLVYSRLELELSHNIHSRNKTSFPMIMSKLYISNTKQLIESMSSKYCDAENLHVVYDDGAITKTQVSVI